MRLCVVVVFLLINASVTYCQSSFSNPKSIFDSAFVYELPYSVKNSFRLVQGSKTIFSHAGTYAFDFKMHTGTPVLAARKGLVIQTRDNSKLGGLGKKFINKGNYVIIRHPDSTYAAYWHLQYKGVVVCPGDTVDVSQPIGFSGNTGYSAFPHLHFEVFSYKNGRKLTRPVRFRTSKGNIYLKSIRKYRKPRS